MKKQIKSVVRSLKHSCFPPQTTITKRRLNSLTKQCLRYIKENNISPKVKVLWPTLFNQDPTWWAHDGVLISALRIRGVEIIPTMCDKLQSDQCMIYSGVWQDSFKAGFKERRKKLCEQCVKYDEQLWDALQIKPVRLSGFLDIHTRTHIWDKAKKIVSSDWEDYYYNDFPLGQEVYKAVTNNNLQGDIKISWRQEADELALHHIFNIFALMEVYETFFKKYRPDRVMGNGGYYYQWGIVNYLCQKKGIPYYRYYPTGLQAMSWNYALNTTEIVHLQPAWDSWLKQPWTEQKKNRVVGDLKLRGLLVQAMQEETEKARIHKIALDKNISLTKPTVLAFTGVVWDANTNIKSKAFDNMYVWLWKTMEWFRQHSNFQLIIRVHPAENIVPDMAPNERSFFENELEAQNILVPDNVIIISRTDKVQTYDIMHLAQVGMTYMSTTGLEFSCLGKPLIAIGPVHYAGKGFTFDPESQTDYLNMLEPLLTNWTTEKREAYQEKAMKYWYLYAFHSSVVTGLFETKQKDWISFKRGIDVFSSFPKKLDISDLLPGANAQIDYYCDAIINNLPIMGENRWPPEISAELCTEG